MTRSPFVMAQPAPHVPPALYGLQLGTPSSSQEEDEGDHSNQPLYSYYENHVVTSVTHVYINKNIGEPAAYTPLVHLLVSRNPGDIVYLHFNSYGGRLDAGIEVLTAMRRSNATIVGCLDGVAYSMAGVLFLACDQHLVSEYGTLMLHTYSGGGNGGKAPDQRTAQVAADKAFFKMIKTICRPFLTARELKDMLDNGRDLYFVAEEVTERLMAIQQKAASKAPTPRNKRKLPEGEVGQPNEVDQPNEDESHDGDPQWAQIPNATTPPLKLLEE